jgi:hypothetical protein
MGDMQLGGEAHCVSVESRVCSSSSHSSSVSKRLY